MKKYPVNKICRMTKKHLKALERYAKEEKSNGCEVIRWKIEALPTYK